MALFPHLQLWEDFSLRSPAAQMACDEALLKSSEVPVLRLYRWSKKAVTFGYAQRRELAKSLAGGLPLMRRWSGGGLVFHGEDLTLALAIPANLEITTWGSVPIYRAIHESLLLAMKTVCASARMVQAEECRNGPACFQSPVPYDIVDGATKLCGGALRRSKECVLYQGSMHLSGLFGDVIATSLAENVSVFSNQGKIESLVLTLVAERYGTPEWLALR